MTSYGVIKHSLVACKDEPWTITGNPYWEKGPLQTCHINLWLFVVTGVPYKGRDLKNPEIKNNLLHMSSFMIPLISC